MYLLALALACAPQSSPLSSSHTWQDLGEALNLESDRSAGDASLALEGSGNPVVAWSEAGNIYVKRWAGTDWIRLGEALNVDETRYAFSPALLIDADDTPVVAWQEDTGRGRDIYAKRWTGEDWEALGGALDEVANLDATSPSLGLAASGEPVVAFREQPRENCVIHVKQWTGQNWDPLGTSLNLDLTQNACRPSLATLSGGQPLVAWYEWDGTSNNILVGRWTGSGWQRLGGPLDVTLYQGAYNPSLALEANGNPVVAWREYDGSSDKVYVKAWTGKTWKQLGSALNMRRTAAAERPAIATAQDEVIVAWQERDGDTFKIMVKRWTGSAWQTLGDTLNRDAGANAYNVSLALTEDGLPVIAWEEVVAGTRNVYVKQYVGLGGEDPHR